MLGQDNWVRVSGVISQLPPEGIFIHVWGSEAISGTKLRTEFSCLEVVRFGNHWGDGDGNVLDIDVRAWRLKPGPPWFINDDGHICLYDSNVEWLESKAGTYLFCKCGKARFYHRSAKDYVK